MPPNRCHTVRLLPYSLASSFALIFGNLRIFDVTLYGAFCSPCGYLPHHCASVPLRAISCRLRQTGERVQLYYSVGYPLAWLYSRIRLSISLYAPFPLTSPVGYQSCETTTRRKPIYGYGFVGELRLRFAARRKSALLVSAPPRKTRNVPERGPVGLFFGELE